MRRIFLEKTGNDLDKRKEFNEYIKSHPEMKKLLINTFFKILK
jgi:hypothetical protein